MDTFLKQITGVVLEETASCLKLSEMTILATPDTIPLAKRQTTQGMAIPRRQFGPFMARWNWASPGTGMATSSRNSKYQRDISGIQDRIISMYARGMTVRDIQSHLEDIYGASISSQTVSNMTDRVLPTASAGRMAKPTIERDLLNCLYRRSKTQSAL